MDLTALTVAAAMTGVVAGGAAGVAVHRLGLGDAIAWPAPTRSLRQALLGGPRRETVAGARVLTAPEQRRAPGRGLQALMASVFALVAGAVGPDATLPALLLLAWLLVTVSIVDLAVLRIPNALVYPAVPALLALLAVAAAVHGAPTALLGGVGAGLATLLLLVLLLAVTPVRIGMGDVKLAAVIALVLGFAGWTHVVVALFAGFCVSAVASIALLLTGRRRSTDVVPLGPGLAVGAILVVVTTWPAA